MKNEITLPASSIEKIENALELPKQETTRSPNQLKEIIAQAILFLINTNMEKLFFILYKIDVPEKLVHESFELSTPNKIAESIAELIIQREYQKIKTRQNYEE